RSTEGEFVPSGPPLAHQGGVFALAFTPAGALFLTAGQDRAVWVRDVTTGRPVGQPMRHPKEVRSATFADGPDGLSVWTATEEGVLRRWDVSTPRPVWSFTLPEGPDLGLSPALALTARPVAGAGAGTQRVGPAPAFVGGGAGKEGVAYLLNADTARPELALKQKGSGIIYAAACCPAGTRRLLTGGLDQDGERGLVCLWEGGRLVDQFRHPQPVCAVALGPDGKS